MAFSARIRRISRGRFSFVPHCCPDRMVRRRTPCRESGEIGCPDQVSHSGNPFRTALREELNQWAGVAVFFRQQCHVFILVGTWVLIRPFAVMVTHFTGDPFQLLLDGFAYVLWFFHGVHLPFVVGDAGDGNRAGGQSRALLMRRASPIVQKEGNLPNWQWRAAEDLNLPFQVCSPNARPKCLPLIKCAANCRTVGSA